ncbi:MAG: radical SAM protein [Planctomycetota bacterium]|nr:radical SAM protein [Planctomycetota bacterium]
MQIVLLHAPPWKIPRPGERFEPAEGPPARAERPLIPDADFCTIPYGLLSLAAQALRAGHAVNVLNLSSFPWAEVERLLRDRPADLYGISCLTINRRGVMAVARLVRQLHPAAHIAVGGPHVTALPQQFLAACPAVDTVVRCEGEQTFLELLERLEAGQPIVGLAGTVTRHQGTLHVGPDRAPIRELDSLASPLDYFPSHILITSRGCPGQCTFCNSQAMWSRKVRFHSPAYVLDLLEQAVAGQGQRLLSVKDDTFTAHRPRALEICRGIRERGLNFVWSCDTRADALDEELLCAMRRAGCRLLSLGVESGSPEILANIRKRITPQQVIEATRMAQRYGFQVRFYMMWGNRGETRETIRQSLELIEAARPNQVFFTLLSIYPGTEEFELLVREGVITEEIFVTHDVPTLKFFLGDSRDFREIQKLVGRFEPVAEIGRYGEHDCQEILQRLPDLPEAHLDLAAAYCRERKLALAERHAQEALTAGYPLPGLARNILGCVAASRGLFEQARAEFSQARGLYPHGVVLANRQALEDWLVQSGPASGNPLLLRPDAVFETVWIERQPEKPVSMGS